MKTFEEFLNTKNHGDESLQSALKLALKHNREEVVDFLEKLASTNKEIRLELDKMNHSKHVRLTGGSAGNDEDKKDVIVPNTSDSNFANF